MKRLALLALIAILGTGCQTRVNGQKDKNLVPSNVQDANQPRISWIVDRQLDSKGNVIGYDSTYTWSYSNNGKQGSVRVDSVMKEFRQRFQAQFGDVFNKNFGEPDWNDSFYYKDFFKNDYYLRKWMQDDAQMRSFLKQMDSSRNAFLNKQYPGLVPKTKS